MNIEAKHIENKKTDGMILQIIISAVGIILGALLLFFPQISTLTLCYVFCAALIIAGLTAIVTFFFSEIYMRMYDRRFAYGVFLIILGCIGLARASELEDRLTLSIGIISLVLCVNMLQSFIQLHIAKHKLWIVELVLTVISLLASIVILADAVILDNIADYPYWVLLCTSAFSLISLLILWFGLKNAGFLK